MKTQEAKPFDQDESEKIDCFTSTVLEAGVTGNAAARKFCSRRIIS